MMKKNEWLYSKDLFFDNLLSEPEYFENNPKRELLERDYKHKIKVLQTILFLELPSLLQSGDECKMEENKKRIEAKVESDELLFGYIFHVSSNPEFDYTWNYMRKQFDKYVEFLFGAKRFFEFVYRDINILADVLKEKKNLHIVFNGLIDVSYNDENPNIISKILWDKFYNITNVNNNYMVSVMVGESSLIVCDCHYKDEPDKLYKKVMGAISNFKL